MKPFRRAAIAVIVLATSVGRAVAQSHEDTRRGACAAAQQRHALATMGVYARVRHPQYIAFIAIMFGFLLQWPTLLTLLMFSVLVAMYVHLAHAEEAEARLTFGASYDRYAAAVPAWFPSSVADQR